ncbi:NIPSNAP family protein [Umezawaea tangerina]|uniref:NIPSNAP protein n=1 Tax=Umezawaea tangerina TaxID=84725 RepID=A0A2T0T794_9PSEU|nr:NIPSNAP family protein [Umezawaea tangerina]PRY41545.1 NIPSNAP protein [Umezawaea tangerina]
MYQLRTYTLRTAEALHDYATVHWARHIPSLRTFGVTTHGIWTDHNADAHRLIALIAYPDGADPGEVTAAYMASPEFAADMRGFDIGDIIGVEELLLDPTAASPLS